MNDEIIISRFEKSDLNSVLDMIKKSFSTPELELIYEDNVKNFWLSEYTEDEIIKMASTKHLYVAKYKGKIVGSGAVSVDNGMAYISGVFVDPTIQGKGIGRKIVEVLENDEISKKYKKIYLTAALSASKFYQKLGYTFKYDVPEIVLDGCLDVVYMEKEID